MTGKQEKDFPAVRAEDLQVINAILKSGGSVEIRRRRDAVVILENRARTAREIKIQGPSDGRG